MTDPGYTRSVDAYAALRIPSVARYIGGNLLTTIGQQMLAVALGWDLYRRSGSPLVLGLVGLAQVIPIIALTLPAGHVVDRLDRRRVLAGAQVVLALVAVGLAAAAHFDAPLPVFYGLLIAAGCARAFQQPAKGALLPQITPPADFANAITWASGSWQLAAVLGPALGGAVIALTGSAPPVYLIAAGAALLFAALLGGVTPLVPPTAPARGRPLDEALAGWRHVTGEQVLLAAITLDLFAVLLGGATALLPLFAKDILHVGPVMLGWLTAAPNLGAVLVSLLLAHRPPMERSGHRLLWSVGAFGVATIIFGLSTSAWLSLAMLFIAGATDGISVVIRSTLVQLRTPDALRGRVAAINSLFIGSSNELGAFESGAVAQALGPVTSVVAGGIGTLLVVGFTAWAWPELRRLGRLGD